MRYEVRVVVTTQTDRYEVLVGSVGRWMLEHALVMLRLDARRHELVETYRALREGKEK